MARIVNVPAGTRNRPASKQSFHAAHDPGEVFDDGQITARQFSQRAYARLAVVDRLEIIKATDRRVFGALISSLLLPCLSSAFLRGLQTTTLATCGLSKSYNHAAEVPSSKVTYNVPWSPAKKSRMVDAFVSRMDSMMILPCESVP